MRRRWIWLFILLLLGSCGGDGRKSDSPPNFVILFCDDLGYGDISPFGAGTETPALERMASEGMKLTSFYSTSGVCTPSRASLLTGLYPRRIGLHRNFVNQGVLFPGDAFGLDPGEVTIAEVLQARGYATGMVGKWHLGDQPAFLPTRQGFDFYFGIPYSNDMGVSVFPEWQFPPLPLMRGETVVETEPDQDYLTQRYTEEAVQFIRRHSQSPFFLYLAPHMPHYPLHASPPFRNSADPYTAAVREIDWSTGRILDTLEELDLDESTLVIFTSDNGAVPSLGGRNDPLRGAKGSSWEGGMRVPCLMRWPGKIPAGSVTGELATTMDLLPTLARLAGARLPELHLDGKDIWPLLSGDPGSRSPHSSFYYYQKGSLAAVRQDRWKLHVGRFRRVAGRVRWVETQELYDLEADVGEKENRFGEHSEGVARLQALVLQARADLGDDQTADLGKNVRPVGLAGNPKPLTQR